MDTKTDQRRHNTITKQGIVETSHLRLKPMHPNPTPNHTQPDIIDLEDYVGPFSLVPKASNHPGISK